MSGQGGAGNRPASKRKDKDEGEKVIATNPIARQNYFIEEIVEAGLVLHGTEAKSMRSTAPNLRDSFVEVRGGTKNKIEAWLVNAHIGHYSHGNIWNHEPTRKRKLLLHKNQLEQMYEGVTQRGMTIIPTRMYFKNGRAKVELGMGKGKKKHDKRETLKTKAAEHEMDQAMKAKRSRF